MSTISDNATVSQIASDNLRDLIDLIASELQIKDYEIRFKQQEFTGDNYCGEISRVQIIPRKGNIGQKVLNLFVKTAPTDSNSRNALPIQNFYVAEVFAYTEIIPAFYRLHDKCNISRENRFISANFYKGIDKEFKEIVILEDLSKDGFTMTDKKSVFDYDHVALVLQNMARIHASSFAMKETHPEQFSKLTDHLPNKINFGEHLMTMIENNAGIVVTHIECPEIRAKLDSFIGKIREICTGLLNSALSEPYNVVCHGDSWSNNMLFKYDKDGKVNQVVFVDWQIVRYSSPLADICQMLCLTTDKHLLNTHLHKLLDLYYETLRLSLKEMDCDVEKSFPKEVFMEHFGRFMLLGLSMVLGYIPMDFCESGNIKPIADYDYKEGKNSAKDFIISDLGVTRIREIVDFFVKNDFL